GRRGDRIGQLSLFDQLARARRQVGPAHEHDEGAYRVSPRAQRGQAMVVTLVFATVLIAVSAAVIDVGGWYRARRQAQATADAAALAGAAKLADGTGSASASALDYASRNGGGVAGADITFVGTYSAGDTIEVTARKPAASVFARLFG